MKAIIPAAGMGTRFLPATKAQPKEMLPVLNKPVIQYVVEEAIAAEADEVIIVNSRDKTSLEKHFSQDNKLVAYLRAKGKKDFLDAVEHTASLPVSFVYQDEPLGLGHAILHAAKKTDGDAFYVLLGDTIVPENKVLKRMKKIYEQYGAGVIAVFPVADDDVSRFGIIAGKPCEKEGDVWEISALVEKPKQEDAPSNLAIFGRYLLSPLVMELLNDVKPTVGGEIQLTTALEQVLEKEPLYALIIDPQEGYDTGTVETWLATNNALFNQQTV